MTTKTPCLTLLCLLAILCSAEAGQATPVLDQQSHATTSGLGGSFSAGGVPNIGQFETAQTFTAGMSGRLTRFDLVYVHKYVATEIPNLLVSVLKVGGDGVPGNTPSDCLAQIAITPDAVPSPTGTGSNDYWKTLSIDLTACDVRMSQGDVFAVAIKAYWETQPTTDPVGYYAWNGEATDGYGSQGYTGGAIYDRAIGTTAWTSQPIWDLGFRTYMDPAIPVPEPASIVGLIAGISGIGLAAIKRR